jgi:DNA-directed RNA polymerase specialized sigma24 family protein
MEMAAPEVKLALDASPSAFGAFYEKALPGVYGYFFHRRGGSAAVAEDLTQETFLAAVAELQKATPFKGVPSRRGRSCGTTT